MAELLAPAGSLAHVRAAIDAGRAGRDGEG